eukprot:8946591-Prorocentrum_lima.AAC.1
MEYLEDMEHSTEERTRSDPAGEDDLTVGEEALPIQSQSEYRQKVQGGKNSFPGICKTVGR